ncbi:MAG: hypothetical protein A2048_01310 [Deltaproteobacteria bacterium GWA2_45_12]|nr:MAG: hypothetical protein A2048_01310 [Deltaproteobacteria bacterium GWA2_45_12]
MLLTLITAARADPFRISSPADLEQCLTYFTQGTWWNWIGGGLTIVALLFTFVFKKTLPQVVMDIAKAFIQKGQTDKPPQ